MTRARIFSQGVGGGGGGGVANTLTLAILEPFLTTANVRETANLYFSNGRAFANLTLASINDLFDVVTRDGTGASTANVGSGLIWTGNVWAPGTVSANLTNFTTDDLPQGANNLYFTNALARRAFTAGNPYIEIDWNLGTISANLVAVAAGANTTDTIPEGVNNLYYKDSRAFANLQLASIADLNDVLTTGDLYPTGHPAQGNAIPTLQTGVKLVYYAADKKWVPESAAGGTADYANVAEYANVVLTLSNFTTDDLVEGANNFYLTSSRLANLLANTNVIVQTSALASFANLAAFANVAGLTNYANVAGLTNYANVAGVANNANTAVFAQTANVANIALRAVFAETANTVIFANAATFAAQVLTLSNFTTSNLAEGSNLYYTDARVLANVSLLSINILADVNTTFANVGEVLTWTGSQWVANSLPRTSDVAERANIANLVLTLSNFTTSNLAEGVNLYFTEQRVSDSLQNAISGKNITVNDLTALGNLTVAGDFATFNVSSFASQSKRITLSLGALSPSEAEGSGIYVEGANALLSFSETDDGFGFNKNLTVNGNIYPALSGRFNLGAPGRLWRGVYIGAQTLYLGNTVISEGPGGGLLIQDQFGNPATIQIANVTSTATVTVQEGGYFGGNTQQFGVNDYGNVYFGIQKNNDPEKFSGMRVVQRPDEVTSQTRGDVIFYTQYEGFGSSTPTLELLAKGNVNFATNVIYVNQTAVLDTFGNFTGNAYLGAIEIDIGRGGTGARTRPEALRNLFANEINGGFVIKAANGEITTTSLVQGTGVYISNADASGAVTIAIGQDVRTTDTVRFLNLTVDNNLDVYGNVTTHGANNLSISDNMIYINWGANAAPNPDLGFAWAYTRTYNPNVESNGYVHGGIYRDHNDGIIRFYQNYRPEPDASQFIDSQDLSFQYANIQVDFVYGDVIGTVSSLANHDTGDLAEGVNLYFTNARAVLALTPWLTTANVVEVTNLYFTNSRVLDALVVSNVQVNNFIAWGDLTAEGNSVILSVGSVVTDSKTINLANGSANASVADGSGIVISGANANILYFEIGDKFAVNKNFEVLGNIKSDTIVANIWNNLYTSNVIEVSSNLYFTNARVLSALATANVQVNNLTVSGDLVVQGNTVTLNTATLTVEDKNIVLANGSVNAAAADGAGITIEGANASITYVASGDKFTVNKNLEISGNLTIGSGTTSNVSGINQLSVQTITTDVIIANTWSRLYTSNVIEGTNLYFTNARVVSVVTPLLTTSNVAEGSNLYYTNARVLAAISRANLDLTNVRIRGDLTLDGNIIYTNPPATTVTTATIVGVDNAAQYELLKFSVSTYRSVKFVYTINTTAYSPGGPQYATGEMLVMHNGSNTYATQYAMLTSTNDDLIAITTEINNSNVRILGQANSASTNTTVRLAGITYTST